MDGVDALMCCACPRLTRRRFLHLTAASAAAGALPCTVRAEDYPSRPVRIIMGFAPGASGDISARVLAQALGRLLGQQFIVENRTGAGSNIATNFVAHAANDGYTLLQGTIANTINPVITPNLPFEFPKDFAPISLFTTLPNIVVVNPSLGVHSIAELIKRSEEHTLNSSHMSISYAVFCLKKKKEKAARSWPEVAKDRICGAEIQICFVIATTCFKIACGSGKNMARFSARILAFAAGGLKYRSAGVFVFVEVVGGSD